MLKGKAGEAVIVRWDQGYASVEVAEAVFIDHFTVYDRQAGGCVAVSFTSAHSLLPDGSHGTTFLENLTSCVGWLAEHRRLGKTTNTRENEIG